jgi:carbon-monoxide dehydrogenase medium subunit
VKAVDFCLHQPSSLPETLDLLAGFGDDGKVLAGGQSLVPLLNFRLARPEHVIDIARVPGLDEIRLGPAAGGLVLGAMVRQARAERSAAVAAACPLLAAALPNIAHPPIRTRGTVCGSMAHADPAAELPTVAVALDAVFVAVSEAGRREVPAAEFFQGYLTTALRPDELLAEVRFPVVSGRTGAAFCEVARRQGDFALAGVAAQVTVDGGVVTDARIAVSGVAGTPFRSAVAEAVLRGTPAADLPRREPAADLRRREPAADLRRRGPAADLRHREPTADLPRRGPAADLTAGPLNAAAEMIMAAISPPGDLHASADYRRHVAGVLIRRAVAQACADAAARFTRTGRLAAARFRISAA